MEKEFVEVGGKKFVLRMTEEEIAEGVKRVAEQISNDYRDKNPLVVITLKGAFMFASDLLKLIDFPCEVSFIRLSSYVGMLSSGEIKEVLPMGESVEGRNVLVIEDIVDTGKTMTYFVQHLKEMKAKDVKTVSFLIKPLTKRNVWVDYFVKEVSDDFVIGYGIDYNQIGRNLSCLYQAVEE